jgi:hypothetical protein
VGNSDSIIDQDSIAQRWQTALLRTEPNLPRPVVDAMVQNVLRGALGESLRRLEEGLVQLEDVNPEGLTGSEARTILAVLTHVSQQAVHIESRIRELWRSHS